MLSQLISSKILDLQLVSASCTKVVDAVSRTKQGCTVNGSLGDDERQRKCIKMANQSGCSDDSPACSLSHPAKPLPRGRLTEAFDLIKPRHPIVEVS